MSTSFSALPSYENKDSRDLPLFPTASAKESSYAFIKRSENFHNKAEYKILDGGAYHHANTLNKLPKVGKPNLNREKKRWFEIESQLVSANEVQRQNAYIVLLGEIYRFEIGNTQPKYRIFQLSPKQAYPISEGVPGYVEFFDYFYEHFCNKNGSIKDHYEDKDLFEGMGRVIFNKFLYLEDDFHFGNMCLNNQNYFVGIDHDNSLAPLLLKLKKSFIKKPEAKKEVQRAYINSLMNYPNNKCIDRKDYIWRINDKQSTDMGTPCVSDYDNLPTVMHYLPAKWQFEWVKSYSECLSKNIRFLNEKHLSLLKSLVTSFIKHELIDIHITDERDCEKTHDLISQRLVEMESFAKQSTAFLEYVKNNRAEAIKIILYEIAEFLNGNKHYQYSNQTNSFIQWKKICNKTLKCFDDLLLKLGLAALSNDEGREFDIFCNNIFNQDEVTLSDVQHIYTKQNMNFHANQLQQKFNVTTLNETTTQSKESDASSCRPKLSRLATLGAFARSGSEPKMEESEQVFMNKI